ncbi:hypothetical protein [Loigolactobacillus backii]|uniref:hypothetical protein n=1 Tax=Loigolactobacillus backii TaxID=375175 RepID=UPI0007F0D3B8|nr:hypothetical protein [Loigolactobacillus backii]ANK59824.1 hypothetical protein AYR52_05845 [Loigolactobacillus backii]
MQQKKVIATSDGSQLEHLKNNGKFYECDWDCIPIGLLFRLLANLHLYKMANQIQLMHLNISVIQNNNPRPYYFKPLKEGDD